MSYKCKYKSMSFFLYLPYNYILITNQVKRVRNTNLNKSKTNAILLNIYKYIV